MNNPKQQTNQPFEQQRTTERQTTTTTTKRKRKQRNVQLNERNNNA
jgi:hypothetical protein